MSYRTVFRPVFLSEGGEGAAPPVQHYGKSFDYDNAHRRKQRPVIGSGDGAVENIKQAYGEKNKQYQMD